VVGVLVGSFEGLSVGRTLGLYVGKADGYGVGALDVEGNPDGKANVGLPPPIFDVVGTPFPPCPLPPQHELQQSDFVPPPASKPNIIPINIPTIHVKANIQQ